MTAAVLAPRRTAWDIIGPSVVRFAARASVPALLVLDEAAGHPFRGNQYSGGEAGGGEPKQSIAQFAKRELSEGHSAAKVAEMAQKEFGSKTTAVSVSWYKSQMNKEAKAKEGGAKPGSIAAVVAQHMPAKPAYSLTNPHPDPASQAGFAEAQKANEQKAAVAANKASLKGFKKGAVAYQKIGGLTHEQIQAQTKAAEHVAANPSFYNKGEADKASKFLKAVNTSYGQSLAKQAAAKTGVAAPAQSAAPAVGQEHWVGGKAFSQMTPVEKSNHYEAIVQQPFPYKEGPGLSKEKAAAQKAFVEKYESEHNAAVKAAEKALVAKKKAEAGKLSEHPPLSSDQRHAAKAYTGSSYVEMNQAARAGKVDSPLVKNMDAAIAGAKLKKDVALYRGIPSSAAKKMFPGGVVQTGQVIQDKGFSSTSMNPNIARSFSKGVVLHIDAKAGAKALDVRHLSSHSWEDEVVLPRDAKLRVVGVLVSGSTKDFLHVKVAYDAA